MKGTALAAALALLAVCAAPWAFGSVPPAFERGLIVLLLAALAVGALAERQHAAWPTLPRFAYALLALGVSLPALQCLPLPPVVLGLLAPASAAIWYPAGVAGPVLGDVWRPVSLHPGATARSGLYLGTLVLLALRLGPWLAQGRRYRFAVGGLAVAGVALAGYAVYARQAFGDRLYGSIAVPTIAPFGPYVSKNHFAGWASCTALLLLGTALGQVARARARHGSRWTESGAASAALTSSVGLALAVVSLASGSRGGALAFVVGIAALAAMRMSVARARRGAAATLVVLVIAVAGIFLTATPEVLSRLGALGEAHQEASGSFRLGIWSDTLRLWAASPVAGIGVGAFADAVPRFKTAHGELRVEHPENEYLELLAESGLLGALVWAGLLALTLPAAHAAARGGPDRRLAGVAHGALAGVASLAAHGLIDFNLRIPANAALAAVLAGFALAPLPTAIQPRRSATAAAGLALLLGLAAVLPPAPSHETFGALRAGSVAGDAVVRDVKQQRLRAELREAVRARPANAELWLWLAWVSAMREEPQAAAALAAHARSLDPTRQALVDASRRLAPLGK